MWSGAEIGPSNRIRKTFEIDDTNSKQFGSIG